MHTKMMGAMRRAATLERVLDALGQELVKSSDEELLQAAMDLGMDVTSKGSAAFIGIKYPATPGFEEFFELPTSRRDPLSAARDALGLPGAPARRRPQRRKSASKTPGKGKTPPRHRRQTK